MEIIGLERFKRDRDTMQLAVEGLDHGQSPERKLTVALVSAMLESYNRIIACVEEGKPFVASPYANAPELLVALDLPWYTLAQIPYLPMSEQYILEEVDDAERAGLGTDMCTLIRVGISNVEAGHVPLPTAFVGLLSPCDGATVLHRAIAHNKEWRNVPMFCTAPPYWEDERGIDFFAGELWRMVTFLEEHTGHRLDIGRLKEVIEESNKQYELWAEYNELRRATPAPHSHILPMSAFFQINTAGAGLPGKQKWYQDMIDDAEMRINENKPEVPNQKIRVFWYDIQPFYFGEITSWLEQEWGAIIAMDMVSYCPYDLIDTSTEDTMYKGMAKRAFQIIARGGRKLSTSIGQIISVGS